MLEDVADLGTREPLVDGHENAARRGDAEMGLEHRGGVSEKRGDSISLVETGRSEPVGELPRAFCELAVRIAALGVDDRDLVRVDVCRPPQQIDRVQLSAEDLAR